ncbi:MAG: STAS domain-containing protein [Bacteroidota bacterium]
MRVEKTVEEKFTIIKVLAEKVDSRIAPQLKTEFVNLVTQGARNLILNLEEVKYIDSSGLSSILVANRSCSGGGGVLVITGVNPHVNKLFQISQLTTVLNISPTLEEARDFVFMHEMERDILDAEKE